MGKIENIKRLNEKGRQMYRIKTYHHKISSVPEREFLQKRKMKRPYETKTYK